MSKGSVVPSASHLTETVPTVGSDHIGSDHTQWVRSKQGKVGWLPDDEGQPLIQASIGQKRFRATCSRALRVGQYTSSLPTHPSASRGIQVETWNTTSSFLGSAFLPPCAPCTPKGTRRAAAVACIQRSATVVGFCVLCVLRYMSSPSALHQRFPSGGPTRDSHAALAGAQRRRSTDAKQSSFDRGRITFISACAPRRCRAEKTHTQSLKKRRRPGLKPLIPGARVPISAISPQIQSMRHL